MSEASRGDALERQLSADDPELRRVAVRDLPLAPMDRALPLLVAAMDDADWRVRKQAIDRLVDWPDAPAVVAAMVGVLSSRDDVGARNAAVDALAQIGAASVMPMIAAMDTGDERLRKFLIDGLGLIGDDRAVPMLLVMLRGEDTNLCVAAAEALGRIGGADAESALRSVLDPNQLHVCAAALDALARLAASAPLDDLKPCLGSAMLRAPALLLLGWGQRDGAAELLAGLRSPRARERTAAAIGLATLLRRTDGSARAELREAIRAAVDADAGRRLLELLADGESDARSGAAVILGASEVEGAVAELAAGTVDIHASQACIDALIERGAAAVPQLVDVAAGADPELRLELFEVLARIGSRTDALERMLAEACVDDIDEEVAAAAVRALAEVGSDAVLPQLEQALSSGGPELGSAAATTLGRLAGDRPDVRMWLSRGMASDEPAIRAACALVLGEVGDATACTVLQTQLSDEDTYARLAAIRALASIGADGTALLRERLRVEDDAEMVEAIRAALADTRSDA